VLVRNESAKNHAGLGLPGSARPFLSTCKRDIAPVAGLIDFRLALVAHASVPAQTVVELITYAKAHSGKISIGSFGNGTVSHVAGELFKMMAGVNLVHVPYRGAGPALVDLLGGQVQVTFNWQSSTSEPANCVRWR
jgi:tripartite-type tricarboxylate transporter receptor subunit TctC